MRILGWWNHPSGTAIGNPWKRIWCVIVGHDDGMYYNTEMVGYDDICMRCGRRKRK